MNWTLLHQHHLQYTNYKDNRCVTLYLFGLKYQRDESKTVDNQNTKIYLINLPQQFEDQTTATD
jgi:hypothetical protein